MNFKKKNKRKGFTLIELIAVIAILGILAAVLVPNIIGYINKAKVSKAVADAKTIVNAVDYYNADTTAGRIEDNVLVSALKVNNASIVGANSSIKEDGFPKEFQDKTTVSDLRVLASGILTYDSDVEGTAANITTNKMRYKIGAVSPFKDMVIFE